MNDVPPPPPPPPPSVPPPPPGIIPNQPAGYVPYGQSVMPTQSTVGLGKAMVVLYWLTTAFGLLATFAFLNRKQVWDDAVNGASTLADVNTADNLVAATVIPGVGLLIAGGIVTLLWINRHKANGTAAASSESTWWIVFAVGFFVFIGARVVGQVNADDVFDGDTISNKLRLQSILALIASVLYAVAAFLGTKVIKTRDRR